MRVFPACRLPSATLASTLTLPVNYPQVAGAVRAMIDPHRFGLAGMHVTVSTVGVIPAIRKVSADDTLIKTPVLEQCIKARTGARKRYPSTRAATTSASPEQAY